MSNLLQEAGTWMWTWTDGPLAGTSHSLLSQKCELHPGEIPNGPTVTLWNTPSGFVCQSHGTEVEVNGVCSDVHLLKHGDIVRHALFSARIDFRFSKPEDSDDPLSQTLGQTLDSCCLSDFDREITDSRTIGYTGFERQRWLTALRGLRNIRRKLKFLTHERQSGLLSALEEIHQRIEWASDAIDTLFAESSSDPVDGSETSSLVESLLPPTSSQLESLFIPSALDKSLQLPVTQRDELVVCELVPGHSSEDFNAGQTFSSNEPIQEQPTQLAAEENPSSELELPLEPKLPPSNLPAFAENHSSDSLKDKLPENLCQSTECREANGDSGGDAKAIGQSDFSTERPDDIFARFERLLSNPQLSETASDREALDDQKVLPFVKESFQTLPLNQGENLDQVTSVKSPWDDEEIDPTGTASDLFPPVSKSLELLPSTEAESIVSPSSPDCGDVTDFRFLEVAPTLIISDLLDQTWSNFGQVIVTNYTPPSQRKQPFNSKFELECTDINAETSNGPEVNFLQPSFEEAMREAIVAPSEEAGRPEAFPQFDTSPVNVPQSAQVARIQKTPSSIPSASSELIHSQESSETSNESVYSDAAHVFPAQLEMHESLQQRFSETMHRLQTGTIESSEIGDNQEIPTISNHELLGLSSFDLMDQPSLTDFNRVESSGTSLEARVGGFGSELPSEDESSREVDYRQPDSESLPTQANSAEHENLIWQIQSRFADLEGKFSEIEAPIVDEQPSNPFPDETPEENATTSSKSEIEDLRERLRSLLGTYSNDEYRELRSFMDASTELSSNSNVETGNKDEAELSRVGASESDWKSSGPLIDSSAEKSDSLSQSMTAVGAIQSIQATANPLPTAHMEDESVDDYMNKLFYRLRGKEPGPEASVVKTPVAPPVEERVAFKTEPLPADPVIPLREEDFVPKKMAPERNADMNALRQLANASTRQAVSQFESTQQKTMVTTRIASIGVATGCAAVFLATSKQFGDPASLIGLASAVAASGLTAWHFWSLQHSPAISQQEPGEPTKN